MITAPGQRAIVRDPLSYRQDAQQTPQRVIDPELRRGIPLTVTLALAVGLLVLVGVGAVLAMGIYTSTANTFSLVRKNIELLTDAAEGKVRDDTFLGVLIATVSVGDLSRAMIGIIAGDGSATDFVLYGRDQVLAHPALVRKSGRQTDRAKPLPTVADFDDGVLVSMWSEDRYPLYIQMPKGIQGHAVNAFGTTYLFVYRELDGYGPKPWLVGGYVNRDAIGEERRRLFLMAGMGAGALVLSLLIALLLARRIAGPVVRLGRRGGRGEPAGSGRSPP